jgi:hypothetical protein
LVSHSYNYSLGSTNGRNHSIHFFHDPQHDSTKPKPAAATSAEANGGRLFFVEEIFKGRERDYPPTSGTGEAMRKVLFSLGAVSLLFGWIHATTLIAIALLAILAFGKVEFSN